jgi:hypothetical protein
MVDARILSADHVRVSCPPLVSGYLSQAGSAVKVENSGWKSRRAFLISRVHV